MRRPKRRSFLKDEGQSGAFSSRWQQQRTPVAPRTTTTATPPQASSFSSALWPCSQPVEVTAAHFASMFIKPLNLSIKSLSTLSSPCLATATVAFPLFHASEGAEIEQSFNLPLKIPTFNNFWCFYCYYSASSSSSSQGRIKGR